MIVSARGQTKSRTARLLPSVTQRSPAIAALVLWRRTDRGAVLKSGPKYSESNSTWGTPPVAASCRARVVLPDPVRPSIRIRLHPVRLFRGSRSRSSVMSVGRAARASGCCAAWPSSATLRQDVRGSYRRFVRQSSHWALALILDRLDGLRGGV